MLDVHASFMTWLRSTFSFRSDLSDEGHVSTFHDMRTILIVERYDL